MSKSTEEKVAIIGLGYVGLPVALGFAKHFEHVVGFDIDAAKVGELASGHDRNGEVSRGELAESSLRFASDPAALEGATFFVVTVPTPVDHNNVPDLSPVFSATRTVGKYLKKGGLVVYESTVYPGVTEEECGPLLCEVSGLARSEFSLGYSPERINPGDREHTLERIVKVVSGDDAATLERVSAAYGRVITAGLHRASSIKVAEAAKVIENTQRDLNIALMNELAFIFDRVGIRSHDVLQAAGTKWNFLRFSPGLVGGHCIGVDPYYLTMKAQQLGYQPEVILAGRRINNRVAPFVAQKVIKLLAQSGSVVKGAKIGVLGLTFKENVSDVRNSKVPDIVKELREFGADVLIHDALANPVEARHEYGLELAPLDHFEKLDGLVYAVSHAKYRELGEAKLFGMLRPGGVLADVKSALDPANVPEHLEYFSL